MMGFAKKQKQLIESLPAVFRTVMKKYNLAPGDFPDIRDFQDKLTEQVRSPSRVLNIPPRCYPILTVATHDDDGCGGQDFSKFHGLKQRLIDDVETVLSNDIPRLMEALPRALDTGTTQLAAAVQERYAPVHVHVHPLQWAPHRS